MGVNALILILMIVVGFRSKQYIKESNTVAWVYTIFCILALVNFAFGG